MEVREEVVEASWWGVEKGVTCPRPNGPVSTLGRHACLRVKIRVWTPEPMEGMTPTWTSLQL